ncbi:MAG: NADH-quinone oxidoreductase subunit G, partial [Deltaproteobacteria bacterium]
ALYHSGSTSTHAAGPLAAVPNEYVELSRDDARELGVKDGDAVRIKANGVELNLRAKVDRRLPKGLLFAPNHFPGTGINRVFATETAVQAEVAKA